MNKESVAAFIKAKMHTRVHDIDRSKFGKGCILVFLAINIIKLIGALSQTHIGVNLLFFLIEFIISAFIVIMAAISIKKDRRYSIFKAFLFADLVLPCMFTSIGGYDAYGSLRFVCVDIIVWIACSVLVCVITAWVIHRRISVSA